MNIMIMELESGDVCESRNIRGERTMENASGGW